VIPLAIQYGMPLNEFWHGDMRLFDAYQKAYYRNISFTAWYNGQHIFEGLNKAIYNGFGRKRKADKIEEYSTWKDPFEKFDKPRITKENAEAEFRKQQADQMSWLFHR
jgi:hypothetical protein